jgi:hypothetical protein
VGESRNFMFLLLRSYTSSAAGPESRICCMRPSPSRARPRLEPSRLSACERPHSKTQYGKSPSDAAIGPPIPPRLRGGWRAFAPRVGLRGDAQENPTRPRGACHRAGRRPDPLARPPSPKTGRDRVGPGANAPTPARSARFGRRSSCRRFRCAPTPRARRLPRSACAGKCSAMPPWSPHRGGRRRCSRGTGGSGPPRRPARRSRRLFSAA